MNGPTQPAPRERLERTAVQARRDVVHAELIAAMQTVERYRGALAILDELLGPPDAPAPEADA